MNKVELQAVKNKRLINIQKLTSYINAGKTSDEKIVKNLIKKIKDAEDILKEGGCEFVSINNDGSFSETAEKITYKTEKHEDNLGHDISMKDKNGVKEDSSRDRLVAKRSLKKKSNKEVMKIGVSIREDILAKVSILAEDSNKKVNPAIIELLDTIFDGNNFKVKFKKKAGTKVTSYNLPASMTMAIEKIHKETDTSVSEIFNILLENALDNFF